MEHIIASSLVKHLDTNGLMYKLQQDFRDRRSCETQLASLVEDLVCRYSQDKQTNLVLLDFFKAFKVIQKLPSYGVRGPTLHWIQAFLSNC